MAEKPAVHPDMAVGEALRAIARDILSEARAALGNQEKPNAATVHDFRKAMKRWRALLRLLRPFLGHEGQRLRIEARDFARELAGARDAQAAIEALEDLVQSRAPLSPRTIASIRARLITALESTAHAVDSWSLDQLTFADLARQLTKTYRRARNDAPDDWRAAEPEVLHELRRRVVAHRYQME